MRMERPRKFDSSDVNMPNNRCVQHSLAVV